MTLYVGGTAVFSDVNTPTSGKYTAAFNYVEVTDILQDYELLTRGYIIAGYKTAQCCDDVNKSIYATNTTHHLYTTVTVGNYNGGWSGTQTAKAIACNLGQCQGTPERTGARQFQTVDMNTDSKITQGTLAYGRYAGSYWTDSSERSGAHKGYVTLGGTNATDRYNFSTDVRDTTNSCGAGTSTYFMTAWPGANHGFIADNANSTWQAMNQTNETWSNVGISGTWFIKGICPGAHTKSTLAFTGNQGVGNVRSMRDNGSTITMASHGSWPAYVCPNNANYFGEMNWQKGNHVSRAIGAHDGIQHSKACIINNGTGDVWACPSLDGYSDYEVCSASGHWA